MPRLRKAEGKTRKQRGNKGISRPSFGGRSTILIWKVNDTAAGRNLCRFLHNSPIFLKRHNKYNKLNNK